MIRISDIEERIKWYKDELSKVSRQKLNDEMCVWYKEHLREMKNISEGWLKKISKERQYENQGLNPPSFYERHQ